MEIAIRHDPFLPRLQSLRTARPLPNRPALRPAPRLAERRSGRDDFPRQDTGSAPEPHHQETETESRLHMGSRQRHLPHERSGRRRVLRHRRTLRDGRSGMRQRPQDRRISRREDTRRAAATARSHHVSRKRHSDRNRGGTVRGPLRHRQIVVARRTARSWLSHAERRRDGGNVRRCQANHGATRLSLHAAAGGYAGHYGMAGTCAGVGGRREVSVAGRIVPVPPYAVASPRLLYLDAQRSAGHRDRAAADRPYLHMVVEVHLPQADSVRDGTATYAFPYSYGHKGCSGLPRRAAPAPVPARHAGGPHRRGLARRVPPLRERRRGGQAVSRSVG